MEPYKKAKHVFIDAGLKHAIASFPGKEISILEVGFGTGLNFLLSIAHCTEHKIPLTYTGLEAFPLKIEELESTGYAAYVPDNVWNESD
ncbi:hypothetical protein [Pedobacter steynii]